jgi:hypothetical protein
MTFPNDFPNHPKIRPLSDAAFRVFVEINGYSRVQDLDGRVPVRVAQVLWKTKALHELETNHPERPTLTIDGDDYVIHNYDEHQQTKAERAALVAKNTENGRKGGRPRKPKQEETQSDTDSDTDSEPNQKQSQSQSQSSKSESEKPFDDVTHLPRSSPSGDGPGNGLDVGEIISLKAKKLGVKNFEKVFAMLRGVVGDLTPAGALELIGETTGRARNEVKNVDAYVATACRKSPEEVLADYDRLDLAALA